MIRVTRLMVITGLMAASLPTQADFQNQINFTYYEYDLHPAYKAKTTAKILEATRYLRPVSESGTPVFEAPYVQRISSITASALRYDFDSQYLGSSRFSFDTVGATIASPKLPVTLDLGATRTIAHTSLSSYYYDARDFMVGAGIYVHKYTKLSLRQNLYTENERHFASKYKQKTRQFRAETLLLNPEGHSFRFEAAYGRSQTDTDSYSTETDENRFVAAYYPFNNLSVRFDLVRLRPRDPLVSVSQAITVSTSYRFPSGTTISVGRKKDSQKEGGNGYGVRGWKIGIGQSF